jgi:DNA-binding transcriptional MerR regulator
VTAGAAAALLGTSPVVLRLREERFGDPVPERGADGQRRYHPEGVTVLRDALSRELSIASAVTEVRRMQPIHRAPGPRPADRPRVAVSRHTPEEPL